MWYKSGWSIHHGGRSQCLTPLSGIRSVCWLSESLQQLKLLLQNTLDGLHPHLEGERERERGGGGSCETENCNLYWHISQI